MITIQKNKFVIVIDPRVEEEERISMHPCLRSKRYVAVINMHSLSSQFHNIKKLMENHDFVKYFYGGNEKFYKEMIDKFTIKRGEIIYMGKGFDDSKLI